jgi:hypothetical protein
MRGVVMRPLNNVILRIFDMALVTALALGAVAAGSVISASSKKKAAGRAADAQRDASDQNAQVQREQLQVAQGALNPYVQRGNAAGNAMNALLGLGGDTQQQQQMPTQQPNVNALYNGGYGTAGQYQEAGGNPFGGQFQNNRLGQYQQMANDGMPMPGNITGYGSGTFNNDGTQATTGGSLGQPTQNAAQAASGAFDNFRNSTGYQFRLGEGMNALNSGYAGAGTLQSGAAMKAATEYGQNYASGEFGNYMGYLGNQQGTGLSGASALAGVGQNYANSITANNNQLASTLGNAALVKGNNNPFAAGLGSLGGGILGMG